MNLIAPINLTGYGYCGLDLLKAYEEMGMAPSLFLLGGGCEVDDDDYQPINRAMERAYTPRLDMPDIMLWHHFEADRFPGRGPRVLYTFFEVDSIPAHQASKLSALDFVCVPSSWGAQVLINSAVTCPVVVCRAGVSDTFHPDVKPLNIGAGADTTVFLACGKWEVRKGYDALLDVFHKAFTPDDDVLLIVNAHNPVQNGVFNGAKRSQEWAKWYSSSPLGKADKIRVIDGRLPSRKHLAALMAAAHCGIFMARAEGWNLEATEMAAMGKQVILTDYSAHSEFSEEAGCLEVGVTALEAAYEPPFFDGSAQWAHIGPDQIEQAVTHLRSVHANKQVNQKGIQFGQNHTWKKTAMELLGVTS